MTKTIEKKMYTYEILNILNWLNQENNILSTAKLPIRLTWDLRKNIKAFETVKEQYEQFNKELQEKYSTDEYSFESEYEDDNGGKSTVRTVKNEYINEFNKERQELLLTENKIDIITFDIESFGDIDISLQDADMLSYFISSDDENKTKNTEA